MYVNKSHLSLYNGFCFQKTKKASPRGDVVDDDAGLSDNDNHISRVGNAYIHSDEVVVS